MKLEVNNDKAKCMGMDNTGNNVCRDRERCGRYMRPEGDRQVWADFWKAGIDCQHYESIKVVKKSNDWDEKRMDVVGQNGNDGLHYET